MQTFADAFPEATWIAIGLPQYPESTENWTTTGVEIERI
jgi:hypothetical protein